MLLFHVKTIIKDSHSSKLTDLKKEDFGRLVTFWFSTFAVLFHTSRSHVGHKNTKKWLVCCYYIKAYRLRCADDAVHGNILKSKPIGYNYLVAPLHSSCQDQHQFCLWPAVSKQINWTVIPDYWVTLIEV